MVYCAGAGTNGDVDVPLSLSILGMLVVSGFPLLEELGFGVHEVIRRVVNKVNNNARFLICICTPFGIYR